MDVLKRAEEAGVSAQMVVGTDWRNSVKAVALAERFPTIHASVGVHPHDAENCTDEVLERLMKLAGNPAVRAWGETGLDFNRMFSPREDQEKWFIGQLEAADTLNLPVILHERDSNGRLLELLRESHSSKRTGVIHCFSGDKNELYGYLDMGFHIGITGIITVKSRGKSLRELAPLVPAERLLIETDAPYLTPAPHRNKTSRNEPAFVKSVLLKLAEVRSEDPEVLADMVWNNTCRLYRVDL